MEKCIGLIQRLVFADMFLDLDDEGSLLIGPPHLTLTHWHLKDEVRKAKHELRELMHNPLVASVFGTDRKATEKMKGEIAEFISVGCVFDKSKLMSGLTLSTCYYLYAFKNGYSFPTLKQLYAGVDEHASREATERIVMWAGIGLTDEQRALIPRFY
jgi:hypothetical protein